MLPDHILSHIFSYLPIIDRWRAASVCRTWHRISKDRFIYQHIHLKDLEFNTLVWALEKIARIRPDIRSLRIEGCYSYMIRHTFVQIQFSQKAPGQPELFSHIRSLQPVRRRREYLERHYTLHHQFSTTMETLLKSSQETLASIHIESCDLDLEMTTLLQSIATWSSSLSYFLYANNGDRGIQSSDLLMTLVKNTPLIKHFLGHHLAMNDTVLKTITLHWRQLESLTLCSVKLTDTFDQAALVSQGGRELQGTSLNGSISCDAFWDLLCHCPRLQVLDIYDLACITRRHLTRYEQQRRAYMKRLPDTTHYSAHHYHPYHQKHKHTTPIKNDVIGPGASLRAIRIAKYTTTPLGKAGLESLLRLFPNLELLEYSANFYTFHFQFRGLTRDMFTAEQEAIREMLSTKPNLTYRQRWDEPITTEQRLLRGMTSVSSEIR